MRQIGVAALVGVVLILSACGSSRPPQNINGPWFANLNNPDFSAAFMFSTNLMQGSGTTVSVTNFSFTNSPPCFVSQITETATFSATGSSNGVVTGAFAMTISTLFPAQNNNVLTLQGNRNGTGEILGTWILTGQSGCTGNGSFTMHLPIAEPR